jgi:tRNA threonylcarbamoyladenosine modification (KEOPS) complex  Pcc1 subunit
MLEANAEIEIAFDTEEEAEVVYNALKPEVSSSPSQRSRVSLRLINRKLHLGIEATDASSFRAAVNTYSRFIKITRLIFKEAM